MMKRYILLAIAASAASYSLGAQDLDPTVVVRRAYEGKLIEVNKPQLDMQVPDSVTRFDLDFDYSVFDKPYKGAYEFNPYLLTMQPASAVQNPKQLYMRAGAGYTLHPEFQIVWATPFRNAFRMNVYGTHRSYVGSYRVFKPEIPAEGPVVIDRWLQSGGNHGYTKGYDLETRAGVDGSYDWKSGVLDFDAAYYGIATKDYVRSRHYDALDVKVGAASKSLEDSYFGYDVDVRYRYGADLMDYAGSDMRLDEHVFGVEAVLGQVMQKPEGTHKMLFDVGMDLAAYGHPVYSTIAGEFHAVPHYVLRYNERLLADVGVRFAKVMRSDSPEGIFNAKEQIVYPDVRVEFDAVPQYLRIYTNIGGGNKMNTYSSILERNHHFDLEFGRGLWPLMDFTVERVSAVLGLKGRVVKFTYDLYGGYVNYADALLDAVVIGQPFDHEPERYLAGMGYAPYQKAFAAFDWDWKTESLHFDGNLEYSHVFGFKNSDGLFAPAALTGEVAFEYNWSRRIYAGVDCAFSTSRNGSIVNLLEGDSVHDAKIPGYADLGLYFEYAPTNSLSFWVRGGNLLNMTIQRNPIYAERGINFTVGLCLNL
ncbi:MAG: hypothetical protein IKV05_07135 [Bacteroidales bacterium]|nr:hypothetical protein [Bacteroidales bacterium]